MIRNISYLLAFCAALSTSSGAADLPAELTQLNESYEKALQAARGPIDAKYAEALKQLLENLTRAGRLDDAVTVRETIRNFKPGTAASAPTPAVAATTPPATAPTPPESRPTRPSYPPRPTGSRPDDGAAGLMANPPAGSIVLNGESASLEGSLKINDGLIENWLRSNSRASWHRRDVPAGRYDVYLVYDAGADMGGALEFEDFGFRLSVAVEPTSDEETMREDYVYDSFSGVGKYKLVPNSSRDRVFKRLKVGTVTTRGGIGLKVSPRDASERGVLNLREIQLVPAS